MVHPPRLPGRDARGGAKDLGEARAAASPRGPADLHPRAHAERVPLPRRDGTFGRPDRPFLFALDPADLRGATPAGALAKAGWERRWVEQKIGEEIVVVIFDTQAPVKGALGVQVGHMQWAELKATALSDAEFVRHAEHMGISASELPEVFDIASRTPVRGVPDTTPEKAAKVNALRKMLDGAYSANSLYTGMGATMSERGTLGGREVAVRNTDGGLKLTPDNHRRISLGVLTQGDVDAHFPPIQPAGTGGTP